MVHQNMGIQAFISASGSGRPGPCEPQTQLWTVKTEEHSYCDTAEGTKQTAHLLLLFRVTTVFF